MFQKSKLEKNNLKCLWEGDILQCRRERKTIEFQKYFAKCPTKSSLQRRNAGKLSLYSYTAFLDITVELSVYYHLLKAFSYWAFNLGKTRRILDRKLSEVCYHSNESSPYLTLVLLVLVLQIFHFLTYETYRCDHSKSMGLTVN